MTVALKQTPGGELRVAYFYTHDGKDILHTMPAPESGKWILIDALGRVWEVPMNKDGSFSTDCDQWNEMGTEGAWAEEHGVRI